MSDADDDLDEDVDDGEGEDEDGEGGGKGKLSGKKLVIFAAPVVIIIVLGLVAFFGGFLPIGGGGEDEDVAHVEEGEEGAVPGHVQFLDLPEMLVNLNTDSNKTTFLKIKVSLEVNGPDAIPQLEAVMPRVLDNFQVYLRELRLEDLNGAAGLFRLKEELLMRINRVVEPVEVSDVLFREMLVQ